MLLRDDIPTISAPNHWCLIGGLADEGEEPRQTFIREALEEINAHSDQLIELPLFEVHDTQHGVFVMELGDEEFSALELGDEGQRFDFFTLDDTLQLPLTRTSRAFLEAHGEIIRQYID